MTEGRCNYPAGYDKKPWCPHTQLVQIGLELAGIKCTAETFCYEKAYNPSYSKGAIHYLEKVSFQPKASCSAAARELAAQLKFIESPDPLGDITSLYDGFAIANLVSRVKKGEDVRGEIIGRWRKVIFETCNSTVHDAPNHHFRRLITPSQLSEEEVISHVKDFKNSLSKIVGYSEQALGWTTGEVKNCPQAPKSYTYGGL